MKAPRHSAPSPGLRFRPRGRSIARWLAGVLLATALGARPNEDWGQWTPDRLKTPVTVELTRNPCQPAVPESTRPLRPSAKEKDDWTPLIQASLAGRVRSVVRAGPQPVVLLGQRLVRPGDEVTLEGDHGAGSAVVSCRLRLKAIASDRLIWMAEPPGEPAREVVCWLDLFLRSP